MAGVPDVLLPPPIRSQTIPVPFPRQPSGPVQRRGSRAPRRVCEQPRMTGRRTIGTYRCSNALRESPTTGCRSHHRETGVPWLLKLSTLAAVSVSVPSSLKCSSDSGPVGPFPHHLVELDCSSESGPAGVLVLWQVNDRRIAH